MFKLESHLVQETAERLRQAENPFAELAIAFEFNYASGRVDIIAASPDGDLITFEAKLTRWRQALNQAYRNSAFAHFSYVLLPEMEAKKALKNIHEFERRGVGLCSFGSSSMRIEIQAIRKNPIQPWLT